jgi:hypothetical protein
VDLTAQDYAAVQGNPFPSHLHQNQLRRAWDVYATTHDAAKNEQSLGGRADLFQAYLRNIAAQRLAGAADGSFDKVQIHVLTYPVPAPGAAVTPSPSDRMLGWWPVTEGGH